MQDSDTGIDKTFNVLIYRVSQCIAIIGCTDLNNMTNILIILKAQVVLDGIIFYFRYAVLQI